MRGNKFEKSHIQTLESETLSRESKVTETAQEIVDSTHYNCEHYTYVYHMSTTYTLCRGKFYKKWDFDLRVRSSRPKMESNTKSITSQFNLTHFLEFRL